MRRLFTRRCLALMTTTLFGLLGEQRCGAQTASQPSPSREAALRSIASNVLAAGWQEVASKCRELTNSLDRLVKAPSREELGNARAAWLAAAGASGRMRGFLAGPLTERDYTATFYYWQVLAPRIEEVLSSSQAIDQPLLDRLGATAKGLFAVEFLLFEGGDLPPGERGQKPSTLELLAGTNSQRRAAYLLAVARDVETKATQIANDWHATGQHGATAKFVAGGQESLNLLVNKLAMATEYAAERDLHFVLVLPSPVSRQLHRIERSRSGSSLEGVVACLAGAQKLYLGGEGPGLADALRRVNAPLDKRLQDGFEAALAAARAIGAPLEQAVVDHRGSIEGAYEKTRALEILIKVDLASALGVTLTFNSNDGD